MNNLVKRIVQKELENHEEPSEKKKKQADSRLGKLLEKIRGKKEPINNTIRKEKRVHIKCKQRIPLNKWIIQFLLCSEEDTIASIKQKLNYTFGMVKTSMVKKHKTVQSLFKTCQECWRMRINFYQHF